MNHNTFQIRNKKRECIFLSDKLSIISLGNEEKIQIFSSSPATVLFLIESQN